MGGGQKDTLTGIQGLHRSHHQFQMGHGGISPASIRAKPSRSNPAFLRFLLPLPVYIRLRALYPHRLFSVIIADIPRLFPHIFPESSAISDLSQADAAPCGHSRACRACCTKTLQETDSCSIFFTWSQAYRLKPTPRRLPFLIPSLPGMRLPQIR